MNHLLEDVVKVMTLERLELDLFSGESRDIAVAVFGGLGARPGADGGRRHGRRPAGAFAACLLPAARRFNAPIVYEVDRARTAIILDARIVAIQHGAQIFNMSASFQAEEPGLAHQVEMPAVAPRRPAGSRCVFTAPSCRRCRRHGVSCSRKATLRVPSTQPPTTGQPMPPLRNIWFRANDAAADDDTLHRCLLAYVSDFHLLDTALLSHGLLTTLPKLQMGEHRPCMWFHRSMRVDDWLPVFHGQPSASGSGADSRAATSFARDGRLVASTCQEGLMRMVAR